MRTCDLCGADLPALVTACPKCGHAQRPKRASTNDEMHPSLEFAFGPPVAAPTASASEPARKPPDRPRATSFDPFDVGPPTAVDARSPAPLPSGESLVGHRIADRYEILELVGEGGMGQVYRALQHPLRRTVCVKVLRPGLRDPAVVRRFEREAKSASRLHHPNSIQVLDFGVDGGTMYLAMEFAEGKDLRKVLREDYPLPEARICHIVAQVLAALSEAHAAQVVHRDLKPDNIMVQPLRDAADFVKVLDFGIAKILESDEVGITAADMVCGTPQYMSPEQAAGRPYDARADLYSIGIILYQLVTGDVPFNGANPLDVLQKQVSATPMTIRERRPGAQVSPELESLIARALSKNPDGRPQTAEIFRRELLAIGERAKVRAAAPQATTPRSVAPVARPDAARAERVSVASAAPSTMQLERPASAAQRPPPLKEMLEPMAPVQTHHASPGSSLPRVGEAARFELMDKPRHKRSERLEPAGPGVDVWGVVRRTARILVIVIGVVVGARLAVTLLPEQTRAELLSWVGGPTPPAPPATDTGRP